MTQSEKSSSDPLAGYRRTPEEYDELEQELHAFRKIATTEVNVSLVRSVMYKDELKRELLNASSPLRRLADHACAVYEMAQQDWVGEDTPDTEKAVAAHANARAARLVTDWISEQIEIGKQAQHELEVEAADE